MSDQESTPENIYADTLSEADATQLRGLEGIEGVGDEIAMLRFMVRKEFGKRDSTDFKLLQSGIRLLTQALLAQHRLTPQQAESLSESMVAFLERFGGALLVSESADE